MTTPEQKRAAAALRRQVAEQRAKQAEHEKAAADFSGWFDEQLPDRSQEVWEANAEANRLAEEAERNSPPQQFARAMAVLMGPRKLPKRDELDPDAA